MGDREKLKQLPSVDEVLARLGPLNGVYPRGLVVAEVRRTLEEMRAEIRSGKPGEFWVEARVERALKSMAQPSLRQVINATGVVLHTNLGRAPLPAFQPILGYSNLEYDVASGKRGRRDVHVGGIVEKMIGKPGLIVNNNAAAIYLALNELAAGHEVIVSRGELIEIGDGFRIPEIMARSGAILKEVGTTNRTRIEDYREALTDRTHLILRVHPSNFRIHGFTARPDLRELVAFAREKKLTLYEDLGSGALADLSQYGIDEPLVIDSIRAGVDLLSFSGDKLLGGPQCGILAGDREYLLRLRKNPMFRALRVDKLIYQSLQVTLRHYMMEEFDRIPALRMIAQKPEELRERANKIAARLPAGRAEVVESSSVIGGGSTPDQSLKTWAIAIRCDKLLDVERALRAHEPPVIARIENDNLMVDLRTVAPEEEETLIAALQGALGNTQADRPGEGRG